MNDSEIDDLIAAAAPVSDAEVSRWDLAGADSDLRDEITSRAAAGLPASPPRPRLQRRPQPSA